jgi:hypothetical protein
MFEIEKKSFFHCYETFFCGLYKIINCIMIMRWIVKN